MNKTHTRNWNQILNTKPQSTMYRPENVTCFKSFRVISKYRKTKNFINKKKKAHFVENIHNLNHNIGQKNHN